MFEGRVRREPWTSAKKFTSSSRKPASRLAASLPDDWVAPLINRIAADNTMRHVRVAREAEAVAICSGAFFGGVRSVALMGSDRAAHLHR